MKLLSTRRSDFVKVNTILPYVSFTGDSDRIYWNITDKQYKHFKSELPEHVIFTLPKSELKSEPKSTFLTIKP